MRFLHGVHEQTCWSPVGGKLNAAGPARSACPESEAGYKL
jgi:hypothetical protein